MDFNLRSTLRHWRHGVRAYIALATVVVTLESWWWAQVGYGGSDLFAIRLEEFYAWLSLALITVAISIGPFYKVFKKVGGRGLMFDARRLIGVSAAWFATLHVLLAYGSLFNFTNPLDLPNQYKKSFLLGVVALLVLLAMAFTSFDAAMRRLGSWWFRLHRFVYLAILFILLHTFLIGAHASQVYVVAILLVAAIIVFGLHVYGVIKQAVRPTRWQMLALVPSFIFLVAIFGYALHKTSTTKDTTNYSSQEAS